MAVGAGGVDAARAAMLAGHERRQAGAAQAGNALPPPPAARAPQPAARIMGLGAGGPAAQPLLPFDDGGMGMAGHMPRDIDIERIVREAFAQRAPGGGLGGLGGGMGGLAMLGGMPGGLNPFMMPGMMPPGLGAGGDPMQMLNGLNAMMEQAGEPIRELVANVETMMLLMASGPGSIGIALAIRNARYYNVLTGAYNANESGGWIFMRLNFLDATLQCLASLIYNFCMTLLTAVAVVCTLGQVASVRKSCKQFVVITGMAFMMVHILAIGIFAPGLGSNATGGMLREAITRATQIRNFIR